MNVIKNMIPVLKNLSDDFHFSFSISAHYFEGFFLYNAVDVEKTFEDFSAECHATYDDKRNEFSVSIGTNKMKLMANVKKTETLLALVILLMKNAETWETMEESANVIIEEETEELDFLDDCVGKNEETTVVKNTIVNRHIGFEM